MREIHVEINNKERSIGDIEVELKQEVVKKTEIERHTCACTCTCTWYTCTCIYMYHLRLLVCKGAKAMRLSCEDLLWWQVCVDGERVLSRDAALLGAVDAKVLTDSGPESLHPRDEILLNTAGSEKGRDGRLNMCVITMHRYTVCA